MTIVRPRVWVFSVVFRSGEEIAFTADDIVVVVGPNNSGKSAFLRAIREKSATMQTPSPVVETVRLGKTGTIHEVHAWLESITKVHDPGGGNAHYQGHDTNVPVGHVQHFWTDGVAIGMGGMARFFVHLLNAELRLTVANPAPAIPLTQTAPQHPIHFLQRDGELEQYVSDRFRQAFGVDLIVHHAAGSVVPLYVGVRPIPHAGDDRVSLQYVRELEKLPQIQTQGDGVRSFAGVLLDTVAGQESIMLIDEPEAFLHPPQARLLGRMLVEGKRQERQLFVATHNGDLLRGILDANSTGVRVVRLQRRGPSGTVSQLDGARIADLWKDPLLRHSNVLDGLFHECVVVCESDGDCRFYAAMIDSLPENRLQNARKPDIMFTPSSGKQRVSMVVRALRAVAVPVMAIVDFDILHHEHELEAVIDAFGGTWDSFKADWRVVHTAIDKKKPELETTEAKADIQAVLDSVTERVLPETAARQIGDVLKRSSAWSRAKEIGRAFLPAGDETKAFDRLDAALHDLGIFIVPVGELESFAKSIGNHGPPFVNEVLKLDLANAAELHNAREFVRAVLANASAYSS